MTWEQYRAALVSRNPSLGQERMTLKIGAAEFMRHLEKAYRKGAQDVADELPIGATDGVDLFRRMFGDWRGDG